MGGIPRYSHPLFVQGAEKGAEMQEVQTERTADCIFVHDGEVRPTGQLGASEIDQIAVTNTVFRHR